MNPQWLLRMCVLKECSGEKLTYLVKILTFQESMRYCQDTLNDVLPSASAVESGGPELDMGSCQL